MRIARVFLLSVFAITFGGTAFGDSVKYYSYGVAESVPCGRGICDGNIDITGTITTDSLGTLTANNIVVWALTFSAPGASLGRITQNNSAFVSHGSPQIVATSNEFDVTLNTTSDWFNFVGDSNVPANWIYGNGVTKPAETILWTVKGGSLSGRKELSSPAIFQASLASVATIPEPASTFLVLLPLILLLPACLAKYVGKRDQVFADALGRK